MSSKIPSPGDSGFTRGAVRLLLFVACAALALRAITARPPLLHGSQSRRTNLNHTLPLTFVLWDTETTAWEGSNERGWTGFVPGTKVREHREIIQISALRVHVKAHDGVTLRLTAGASERFHVRPTVHATLSSYITRLTNITQDQVDGADGFLTAAERLQRFVSAGSRASGERGAHADADADACAASPMLSWGDDFGVVESNARLLGVPLPPAVRGLRQCSRDVKHVFRAAGLNLTGWHSGTIHRHPAIGHATEGHVHDSGWDVVSLLLGLQTLSARSEPATLTALRAALGRHTTMPLVASD